ncbi:Protein DMR6-LIKE OXYGENASE 1 [Vigna angularis]|uniref:Protein DMR6-LIKE OXYGENASE 1 n=1 Tax=Phaseolus angularis TaxID=3914 RepID=A0A8T0L2P5_PHAAN|nr:Protein DMR6-LIKE OXYGENASE 1 [Vigna angularis]
MTHECDELRNEYVTDKEMIFSAVKTSGSSPIQGIPRIDDPIYMSPAMALNEQRSKDDAAEEQIEYEKGEKHLCEKGHIRAVPKKYILPVADRPTKTVKDSNVLNQNLQLPIIDFAELLGPNRPQVLQSLSNACQQYGFFQLVNHCISDDVVRSMIDVSGRFFDLPLEERVKYMTTDMGAPVRCGTSFSQTKDSVLCWRDFLKLLCHPLPDFLPHWPVSPLDFRFCVGIDQIYSNGKYKSILHRVIVNEVKSRVSVASLHSLPFNSTVKPSPKLVDEDNPKRYMDTDFATFLAYVSSQEPNKKDFLESRKLL